MGYLDMKWLFGSGSCGPQRQQLSLLAAGMLTDSERAAARAHLEACAGCRRYFVEMRTLSGTLSAWSQTTPDLEPTPAWRARWMRSIALEQEALPEPLIAGWRALLLGRRGTLAGLAAVWTLILFFRLTTPEVSLAKSHSALPAPRDMLRVFQMQERLLSQWQTLPNAAPEHQPADRPPKPVPSPRSDEHGKVGMC